MEYVSIIILGIIAIVSIFTDYEHLNPKYKRLLRGLVILLTFISIVVSGILTFQSNQEKDKLIVKLRVSQSSLDNLQEDFDTIQLSLKKLIDIVNNIENMPSISQRSKESIAVFRRKIEDERSKLQNLERVIRSR